MRTFLPCFFFVAWVATSAPVSWGQATATPTPKSPSHIAPDTTVCALFGGQMDALEDDDYAGFIANASDEVRASLPKEIFERVVGLLGPRIKSGYSATWLGEVRKGKSRISLWKIEFRDGGDDMVAQMSVRDGKIGGFILV